MTQQELDFRKMLGLDSDKPEQTGESTIPELFPSAGKDSRKTVKDRKTQTRARKETTTVHESRSGKRASPDTTTTVQAKTLGVSPELYRRIRALSFYLTLTEGCGRTVSLAETVGIMLEACLESKGTEASEFVERYSTLPQPEQ